MSRSHWLRRVLPAAALLLVDVAWSQDAPAAEAWRQALSERGYRIDGKVDRLDVSRIGGHQVLDGRHVILSVGVSDKVLMRFEQCPTLSKFSVFVYDNASFPLTGRESILVQDWNGTVALRCRIESLQRLERRERAENPV